MVRCPVIAFLAVLLPLFAAAHPPEALPHERWKGVIELPGMKLEFWVRLHPAGPDTPATGTIDIPMQGLSEGELSNVEVSPEVLSFTLALPSMPANAHAHFAATIQPDGKTARGELRQAGGTFPLTLERVGADAELGPARPQRPRPPFPYTQREVAYTNPADGTRLAGTLTLPAGPGPHPAVVLITGSGPQDRDETIFSHKPFWVLADHLTRNGIAVLRSDDRGVGGSTGSTMDSTTHDFAADALAAVALLRTIPEIDSAKIGLIGHSEGGVAAPIAAAQSRDVAFIVLLAGTGMKGRDILTLQSAALLAAAGATEDAVAEVVARHRRVMDLVEAGAPREEILRATKELVVAQQVAGGQPASGDAELTSVSEQVLRSLDSPWLRAFLPLDPREALRRVTVPVLAINGGLDLQVPPRENLAEIDKALREAGNRDVTIRELPGLNHLFQTAATGLPTEYGSIEETFAPAALSLITEWILARTGPAK